MALSVWKFGIFLQKLQAIINNVSDFYEFLPRVVLGGERDKAWLKSYKGDLPFSLPFIFSIPFYNSHVDIHPLHHVSLSQEFSLAILLVLVALLECLLTLRRDSSCLLVYSILEHLEVGLPKVGNSKWSLKTLSFEHLYDILKNFENPKNSCLRISRKFFFVRLWFLLACLLIEN